jgi:SGNH hydrolase-like domain, acetyltransferase AlgX
VKRYAADALRFIYDDRILPNVYADNVVRGKLRNGDVMSFLPLDLRPPQQAFPVPVEYWRTLKRELETSRRKLFVILIPNKYTIYQRLLAEEHKWPMYGDELLSRNEAALRSLKIPVVNLAPALRAEAEAGIDRQEYLYWRNDTHWNWRGVKIASAEIARAFPELTQSCKQ